MLRFYILPMDTSVPGYLGPKYLKWRFNPAGIDAKWGMYDYGAIDTAFVAADVTQAQHEQLVAESDVAGSPVDIDQNISLIAIPQLQAVMESLRIPAGWIDDTYTYRQILRMIAGLFQFAQRHRGMHNEPLIDSQAQLDLRWNQIPAARQDRIKATADDRGYDYSEITNTWTIRQILKHLGDQWGDSPFIIGGFEF